MDKIKLSIKLNHVIVWIAYCSHSGDVQHFHFGPKICFMIQAKEPRAINPKSKLQKNSSGFAMQAEDQDNKCILQNS